MTIYRADKSGGHFTQVMNDAVRDKRMSYRALGILVRCLSNVDEWVPSVDDLRHNVLEDGTKGGREGRDAIRSALKELDALGYRVLQRSQDDCGQFSTTVHIYERPVTTDGDSVALDSRRRGNQTSDADTPDSPSLGNRTSASQEVLEEQEEDHSEDHEKTTKLDSREDQLVHGLDSSSRVDVDLQTSNSEALNAEMRRLLDDPATDFAQKIIVPVWLFLTHREDQVPPLGFRVSFLEEVYCVLGFAEALDHVKQHREHKRLAEWLADRPPLEDIWSAAEAFCLELADGTGLGSGD